MTHPNMPAAIDPTSLVLRPPAAAHFVQAAARETLAAQLRGGGYAVLEPSALGALAGHASAELDAALHPFWNDLPPDAHLKDGGRYRHRRHGCYVQQLAQSGAPLEAQPHRAHWQPTTYNALHGGIERWFEPLDARMAASAAWRDLIAALGLVFAQAAGHAPDAWFIEAHPFRIDTRDGVGRPTPEGAHRDGVDYVAVVLIERRGVRGGETRVFEADGPHGVRFTLDAPWSALLLDDARVIHESTPIQPVAEGDGAWRDTLVLTYRAGGFQAPTD